MDNITTYLDSIFVNGLVNGSITIAISIVILLIINRLANTFIKKHWGENILIRRAKRIILYTIGIAAIFMQVTPLQSFSKTVLASGGLFAVVIGLASQEAASNMINGIMIFAYKPYTIGDNIHVTDQKVKGKVLDISLRHTIMETMEKTQIIIPNTIMNKAIIENISNISDKKANYFSITISYDSDANEATKILQEIIGQHLNCLDIRTAKQKKQGQPKVPVYCTDITTGGMTLRATIFSKNGDDGFTLLSDIRQQLPSAFIEKQITIINPNAIVLPKNQS